MKKTVSVSIPEEKLTALVESMKAEKIAGNHTDKSQNLDMQILAM